MRKLTTEEFIQKAKEIHEERYDYSKVKYVDTRTKVIIICPEHGIFEQTPASHLRGKKCPQCANKQNGIDKRKSTDDFIKEAKEIHEEKYDYSLVEYRGNKYTVTIICPIHGEFKQKPNKHLSGQGCPKCLGKYKTTEEFIKEAKEIHGNKYDYSKVKYVNSSNKVTIVCLIHGEFKQKPNGHLSGKGCPKCAKVYKPTTEEFIEKVKEMHRYEYDYSKVNYINTSTNITIICFKHGEFQQTPENHLNGCGCPKCAGRQLEYLNFEEAKTFIRNLGIKTQREYQNWWMDKKPQFLPFNIERYYKFNK